MVGLLVFGYLPQLWAHLMVRGDGTQLSLQYTHHIPLGAPCRAARVCLASAARSRWVAPVRAAPGLGGGWAGRKRRQGKGRQEARQHRGLTEAAPGHPVSTER